MQDLIPIETETIGTDRINTVNARTLHVFLESKQDFSDWIKKRISQYGFVESVDFIRLHKNMEANNAKMIEYHIALDMAKELSMVERNQKGKEARQYFIECERQVRQGTQFAIPQTFEEALRALADKIEETRAIEAQRDEAIKTKAQISDRKTATAMSTASAAVRKSKKLEEKLGIATNWKSAKSIPWIGEYLAQSRGMWIVLGKKLKFVSDEIGVEVRKIESDRFGKVNSYHLDAIEAVRVMLEADDNLLGKYRKSI